MRRKFIAGNWKMNKNRADALALVHGLMEVWKVTAYLGVAFWAGVIWKKANRYGALASALTMASPKPTAPAMFSVPLLLRFSCAPPIISGSILVPFRM